jgi:hypothetical protein
MREQTGLTFLEAEVRNGGKNNGPDMWNLDLDPQALGGKAVLTVFDAKGSIRGKSDVNTPDRVALYKRTVDWITEVHNTGKINGSEIASEIGKQQYAKAWDLLQKGQLDIVTGIVQVDIPPAGTVGTLIVRYVANPANKLEALNEGAVPPNVLDDASLHLAIDAAAQVPCPRARLA